MSKQKSKTYYIDIDGVLCTETGGAFWNAEPIKKNIKKVNKLYDEDNTIVLWTTRGTISQIDWRKLTEQQLKQWKVKYNRLRFGKPYYDVFIDDKASNKL